MQHKYITLLQCPRCMSKLSEKSGGLRCKKCLFDYKIKNGILILLPDISEDIKLSISKWEEFYDDQLKKKKYKREYKEYMDTYHSVVKKQLLTAATGGRDSYLEIGSGLFFMGQDLADEFDLVIGIDFCFNSLLIAKKMLEEKKIKNFLLIQGDILHMPLSKSSIDLIYGGGVIEHFPDTAKSVNELGRITKKKGVSFNTVPYLGIGSMTYRQLWGNIPDAPFLRQIMEFIHIRLLGAKHMRFGYELSFTANRLIALHKAAGFTRVKVSRFDIPLVFEFFPKPFRPVAKWIANNIRLFWPMVKVVGVK